jgi:ribonucleotide monophosphatase NagD (HAD superfamily)
MRRDHEGQVQMTAGASQGLSLLVSRYDAFLLDAYGVLNDGQGSLAIGRDLVACIEAAGKSLVVVTNDASRLPGTLAMRLMQMGYRIPVERIVTAGDMLVRYLQSQVSMRLLLLGTEDSALYLQQAGAVAVAPGEGVDADGLVLCDEAGFDFREAIEACLSAAIRAVDDGRRFHLYLANPDLVYPKARGEFGVTAGAMAALIEAVLHERYGEAAPRFVCFGKPNPEILFAGIRRFAAVPKRVLMVGEQYAKDVRAAHAANLHAALIGSLAHAGDAEWVLSPAGELLRAIA